MAGSPEVRALKRGLDVLMQVSRSRGTQASEIAKRLGLPRATVYRLLETLEVSGYVVRNVGDDRFHVTRHARKLGEGYDTHASIREAARPVLLELSRRFSWPVVVMTYDLGAMVIEDATEPHSPSLKNRYLAGRRLHMLHSASGRAYLAFCSDSERETIVDLLLQANDPENRFLLEPKRLKKMLETIEKQGFCLRSGESFLSNTSTIAVPIKVESAVIGCVAMLWVTSALKASDAASRFFNAMQKGAAAIAANYVE